MGETEVAGTTDATMETAEDAIERIRDEFNAYWRANPHAYHPGLPLEVMVEHAWLMGASIEGHYRELKALERCLCRQKDLLTAMREDLRRDH